MTFGILLTTRKRVFYSIFTAIVLVLYVYLGAVIFVAIEEPYQNENPKFQIEALKAIINNLEELKLLIGNSSVGLTISEEASLEILNETSGLADDLLILEEQEYLHWNLQTGIHFCMMAVTTIGYGYIAPVTQLGRGICIPYILLGIPLNIFFSANFGFFIARGISKVYSKIKRNCKDLCSSNQNHQNDRCDFEPNPVTVASQMLVDDDWEGGYCHIFTVYLPEKGDANPVTPIHYINGAYSQDEEPRVIAAGILNGNASQPSTSTVSAMQQRPDFIPERPTRSSTSGSTTDSGWLMDAEEKSICPLWFIALIVSLFCSVSALIPYSSENGQWTFLDAFYFTIVTFTTVGFGDMRSQTTIDLNNKNGSYKWWTTVYTYVIIEVGLILLAASITVWSDYVKATAKSAKQAIRYSKITRQVVSRISQFNVDTPENQSGAQ